MDEDARRERLQKARERSASRRESGGEDSGPGIMQIPGSLLNMAWSMPAGFVGMAGDTLDTVHNIGAIPGTLWAKKAGELKGYTPEETAKAIEDTPLGLGKLFAQPDMIRGVKADAPADQGLGKFLQDNNAPIDPGEFTGVAHELFPLFGALGGSFNRSIGRGVDLAAAGNPVGMVADVAQRKNPFQDLGDTKYAQAWNEGEIVPTALEDVANASIVLSGGGALAGKVAGRAGVRAGVLEGELAATGGSDAAIAARAARARSVESAAAATEQGFNKAATLTARGGDLPATMWKAPGLLGETQGGRFGLFRKGAPAANLSEKLIPFGQEGSRTGLVGMMRERGLTSLVDNLDTTNTGAALVNWAEDHPIAAVNKARMKMRFKASHQDFENAMTDARQGIAQGGVLAVRAAKEAGERLGLDGESVGAAATMAAAKIPESLSEILDDGPRIEAAAQELHQAGMIAEPDVNMARDYIVADVLGPENVLPFKVASQFSRGAMDPEAAVWFQRVNDRMDTNIRAPRAERYKEVWGEKNEPTPESVARRQEQFANEPMPSVVEEAVAPAEQRVKREEEKVARLQKLADIEEAKLLDPNFTRPARDIAADVAPTVPERTLGPIERSAAASGVADDLTARAQSRLEAPLVEPATSGEVSQAVRQNVRAQDAATAANRRLGEAEAVSYDALNEAGRKALPKDASLLEPGAEARTLPPRERARAVVEEQLGPEPKTVAARKETADAALARVKDQVRERIDLEAADLAREADQKFGHEALPELPFIPPMRPDGTPSMQSMPEFWGELGSAQARADFAAEYMVKETPEAKLVRAEQDHLYAQRNRGQHLYEDWESLADKRRATKISDRPALRGDQSDFGLQQYRDIERFNEIEGRHRQGYGAAGSEQVRGFDYGAADLTGGASWVDDWKRIADEQKAVAEKRQALAGTARGKNRDDVNISIDQLDPEQFVVYDEIGPGVEVPAVTRGEVEAVLRGFDENGNPLKIGARRDAMNAALKDKRAELLRAHEEMYQRQVDNAFSFDFEAAGLEPPWKLTRDEFSVAMRHIDDALDEAASGVPVDPELLADFERYRPEGFDGTPDQIHNQWLHRAEERGLDVPTPEFVTPDQLADQAIGSMLAKVTDAFDADGGVKGPGFQSLDKKERAVYRRMEKAAAAADAATVVADSRAAVSDLQKRYRQGIVDDTLDRQALRFGADAEKASVRAGDVYQARLKSIENVLRQTVKQQRKVGLREGAFQVRQKDLNRGLRDLDKAIEARTRKYAEAMASPEATPARFGEGTRARSKAARTFYAAAEVLDQQAPGSGDLLRGLADDTLKAVDAYHLSDLMDDPTHIISGDEGVRTGRGGATGRNTDMPDLRFTGAEKQKRRTAGQSLYGIKQQTAREAARLADGLRNEWARTLAEQEGGNAAHWTAVMDQTRRGGADLRGLTGRELREAADKAGYVGWDPATFTQRVPDSMYGPDTILIPKTIKEAAEHAFNESGSFMKGIEKWYDRRFMGQIKMFWLALSPRWLTANIVGNAVMGMVGGGVAPWDFIRHSSNARALLAEEAPIEWRNGNRLERRLYAKRQKLVGRGDAIRARNERYAALGESLRQQGFNVPEETHQLPAQSLNRGFTHEELPMLMGEDLQGPKSPVRKAAAFSYRQNEYVDNINRAAVYLAKAEPRRLLWEKLDRGEISQAEFFKKEKNVRTYDQALQQALRAAGDFSKMTWFEKNVIKRAMPFYPWYRHITKLAMSMPIYSPTRTVWLLHLADVFGGDPTEERGLGAGARVQANLPGFSKGSVPLGGDQVLATAGMNPFEAGLESPFSSAEGLLGATSPAIQWPAALLFGKDAKHGLRDFSRSPGSGNLDEYGRPTGTPLLSRPGEAARYLANQLPQGRLWFTGTEEPVLRYDTGEPMIVGGKPIPSGRPSGPGGVALGALGIPTPLNVDSQAIADRAAKRNATAAKSRTRYQSQRERLGI